MNAPPTPAQILEANCVHVLNAAHCLLATSGPLNQATVQTIIVTLAVSNGAVNTLAAMSIDTQVHTLEKALSQAKLLQTKERQKIKLTDGSEPGTLILPE